MNTQITSKIRSGFTLFELLIAIGILLVMATIVMVAINPTELLKQSRDAKRLVDIRVMESGIELYLSQVEDHASGTPQTIYISIPDTDPTCRNLRLYLPEPPVNWSYGCSTSANYRKIDGTGWLPIDFTRVPGGSPLETLPVDAKNNAADLFYYAYVASSSDYALSTQPESTKMLRTKTQDDKGLDPIRIEVGSNLNLWSRATGLIGYWPLDGSANDRTEYARNGTLVGGPTLESSNCARGQCINFDGLDDYVNIASQIPITASATIAAWFNLETFPLSVPQRYDIFNTYSGSGNNDSFELAVHPTGYLLGYIDTLIDSNCDVGSYPYTFSLNSWHLGVLNTIKYPGGNPTSLALYNDANAAFAALLTTAPPSTCPSLPNNSFSASLTYIGKRAIPTGGGYFDGLIDEVRLYSRPFQAREAELLYAATKK